MFRRYFFVFALLASFPLIFLYSYQHSQHAELEHPHRKHVVLEYLERDSASSWARIVQYSSPLVKHKTKSKAHYEYEFRIKNKKYRGQLYETEVRSENLTLNVNDSIRVIYSRSDPFLNIPHLILDDLKD